MLRTFAVAVLALLMLVGCGQGTGDSDESKTKLGFMVKQPEEPWFQLEWKFADEAAKKYGFELIRIGASDGEKVLSQMGTLAAKGAQGLVICTPDVKLGPAIVREAKARNLKLIAVDDQFMDADGKPMTEVHYLGISARQIGQMVGKALYEQMQKRQWPVAETGLCVVTFDELDTARERTEGAIEAIVAAGFPKERIYKAAQAKSDVPAALDATTALLTRQPGVKHWLIAGMNDSAVMGAVRAMEGRQFKVEDTCGIGINGTDCLAEFDKPTPTGFHASVLLTARKHGYDTAEMLYKWVKDGVEPPKDTRTTGILIDRSNYRAVLKEQGIRD